MKDECIICKAPLIYLNEDVLMECTVCHKKELSKTRCVSGHYVCNECHTQGVDGIFGVCLAETSKNPIEIINKMMALPFCHMHGPEHHIMVGAALLTAYKNAGGNIDLKKALAEMSNRGRSVPGGACGFWGACGAGVSSGMFISIITGSTPLAGEPFGLSNRMTAKALNAIGEVGGPRCCKRDSYLSIIQAVEFVKQNLGVKMEVGDVVCGFSNQNNQCIGKKCPFSARILETQRLYLRKMEQSDFDSLCRILQDEETMYAYEGAFSDTEVQDWLDRQINRYEKWNFGLWAVILKETDEMIGQCGLTMQPWKDREVLEIGYLFESAYWHNGYAIEAAKACKEYAFEILKADEVCSIIRDTNIASQKVAIRNGMTVTDSWTKHYRGVDMLHYRYTVCKNP